MNGDKLTRVTGYIAVFAVAGVAALLSYWHAVAVVGAHGEPGVYGHLYPATIDGLVVAASMVLLDAARRDNPAPRLAWGLLVGGILATLGANVLNGISYGLLGSVIAAWPALALVGAYEMIMVLIRSHAKQNQSQDAGTVPTVAVELPMTLTPGEVTQLERELDAEPRPMPKLAELLAEKPPWEESKEYPGRYQPSVERPEETQGIKPFDLPESPRSIWGPGDTQAVPMLRTDPLPPPITDPVPTGTVHVQSPLSRLDRKIPADIRNTGAFPAVTD